MATILQVKYYNIETGKEIPMSQGEEDKQKKTWYKKLGNWLFGTGTFILVGIFWGIGAGGGPFEVKRVVITAVDRPGINI
jgi:hypothetical protein